MGRTNTRLLSRRTLFVSWVESKVKDDICTSLTLVANIHILSLTITFLTVLLRFC